MPTDVLSKVEPEPGPEESEEAVAKKLEAGARHLSKYIFPRQYDLQNAFTSEKTKKSPYPFPDWDDREDEILVSDQSSATRRGELI